MFIYQIGDLLGSHSIPIRHGYCIWGERCLYKLLVGSITETYIQTIKADSKGILRSNQRTLCEAFPIVFDYHIHPVAIVEASNCSSGLKETYIQTIKADSKGILRSDQKALCEAFPIVSDYHIHPVAIVEASNCSSGPKETYIQTIAMIIYVSLS